MKRGGGTEPRSSGGTERRSRTQVALRVVYGVGLGGIFTAGVLAGLVLHVNVPAARRFVASQIADALSGTFYGTVTLGSIEHLGLRGSTLTEVTVKDEAGNQVLVLTDLRVRTDALLVLRDVLFADDKVDVIVRHIRAERAEVQIIPDPLTGVPTIGRALTPVPKPKKVPAEPSAPSKPVRVYLPSIDIAKVNARGTVAGLPVLEVSLGGVRGSVLVTPKGAAVDVFRYGVVVRGLGGTDATGTGELHVRAPGAVWGAYDGFFGNLPVSASWQVKGQDVTATVDVPKGMPEDVKLLLPDWPLQRAVSAHVEASGKLPELTANAKFEIEGARIAANGPIRFGRDFSIDLDVQGRGVDIRALWPKAPATNVDIDTALNIYTKERQVVVEANGTTASTNFLGEPVPPIDVSGKFDHEGFKGKATVHEPGMPLKVGIEVALNGSVDLDVRAPSFQLEKAPRVEKLTAAKGRAEISAKAHIEKNKLEATMLADVSGFELGDVALRHARVSGKATGPLDDPKKLDIDAKLTGRSLETNGMTFEGVKATATGLVTRPRLTAKLTDETNPNVDAKGTLETSGNPGIRNVSLVVEREGVTVGGKVSRLDFDSRDVHVEELALKGAGGELVGSARVGPNRIELKAKGEGIDLDRVTRALRLPRGMLGGRLNIDADVVASKGESRGYVRVGLGKGSIASVGGIALSFDATLEGDSVKGKGQATVEDFGRLGASFSGKLAGAASDPESWKGIVGQTELQLSDVELSWLKRVLPASARIEKIGGTAFARLRVERNGPKLLPNIAIDVAGTRKLEVVRSGEKTSDEPLVIEGIEVVAIGGISGEKGDASGTTLLVDDNGRLLTASGSIRLDWRKLMAESDDWLSQLSDAPILVVLSLDQRPIQQLPKLVRPKDLEGAVHARLMASGSLADLKLGANLGVSALRTPKSPNSVPVDIEATGQYEVESGRYGANVQLLTGPRRVGRLIASGTASLDGAWTGGAQLALEGIPLAVVPELADSRVDGRLEGAIVLQRTKPDAPPRMTANVELMQMSVDRTPLGGGHFTGAFDGQQVKAALTMKDQAGEVSATLRAAAEWTEALPTLGKGRPVRIDVESRDYDAAVLSPFLRDLFSRLTGKVNGKLALTLEPKPGTEGQEDGGWRSRIEGSATVRGGVLQIAELGLELTDVSFKASAREAGPYAVIELNDIEGKARSEKPSLKAWARIYLEGVRVKRGEGALSIGELPLLLQGVTLATASKGLATLELERQEDEMKVTIDITQLTAKLPESSGRSVVDLGDNPTIQVVQALREPRPPRTGEILPWRFVFKLGKEVRLIRSDMNLPLVGQPEVELAKKTRVSGHVELEPGGRFQYLGKSFAVETGRVTFDTEDASDPHIAAVAGWRGPDGTVVYADVRGTLKQAKVTVTSDPPRPEPEIMALLFGGSSASTATSEESQGSRGRESSAAASGVLAQAFNTIFAEPMSSAPVQVELRTATNEDKASYTAAVQVAENIWFEGTYRNRLEAQQEAASTEPVDVSGTIDWRFRRNWSLRTEVGTLGTGLDLLFQYRY